MHKVLKAGFILYVFTIMYLSFYPTVPETPTSDKVNHFIAFFVFSIFYRISFKVGYWNNFISALIFGAFIEFIQSFLPYRYAEYADFVADAFGALCGMFLVFVLEFAFNIIKYQERNI